MSTRRRLVTFFIAAVLVTFPVALWLSRSSNEQSPWRPEQRPLVEKIDETVQSLAEDTPAQLVSGLKDPETYEFPGVRSLDLNPQNQFEWVLSSRRTLKLLADLAELASEDARRRAHAISGEMSAVHEDAIQRALNHMEDPKAPENTQSMRSSQFGQCCALFFLARFSDAKAVLEELLAIEQFSQKCQARISANDAYPESFLRCTKCYYEPDNAFKLNVLLYAIECDDTIAASAKENLRRELSKLPRKEVVLTAWDAETTFYELAHAVQGGTIDSSKGTTTLIILEWSFEYDEAKQKETIKIVVDFIQSA